MKSHSIRNALVALVVLLAGVVAYFIHLSRWSTPPPTTLRVLCAEEWLNARELEEFAKVKNARIDLYTYKDPAEMLRQLANADGRLDVICTSSLLLRNLVRNGWIKRVDYDARPGGRNLAADFLHLPYDPNFEYGFPLYWQAFGYSSARPVAGTLKQILGRGKVGVWATMLNYMALLTESGLHFEDRLEDEDPKRLYGEVQRFVGNLVALAPDLARVDPSAWLKRVEVAHVPSIAAPPGTGFFGPGEDGGIVDVSLLAVGERAANPELALDLIAAVATLPAVVPPAVRLGLGVTLGAAEGEAQLKPQQRPSALRATPLTKLRFSDVDAEALLKLAKIFETARASAR